MRSDLKSKYLTDEQQNQVESSGPNLVITHRILFAVSLSLIVLRIVIYAATH